MADLNEAVQFVLRQEDSRLSGEITTLPGDRGGRTRFGLAERWHPELAEKGYFDMVDGEPKIPHDDALATAEETYEGSYAPGLKIGSIDSQAVANHLLSFAVNEGPAEAVALLQRALGTCGSPVAVDGILGPTTLAAINAADPARLLGALRACEEGFYRHLVSVRPELLPDLHGLLNRAQA